MGGKTKPGELLQGTLDMLILKTLLRGWLDSEWGASENQRRAKYYRLTAAGRKQLAAQAERWGRMSAAIARVMA